MFTNEIVDLCLLLRKFIPAYFKIFKSPNSYFQLRFIFIIKIFGFVFINKIFYPCLLQNL